MLGIVFDPFPIVFRPTYTSVVCQLAVRITNESADIRNVSFRRGRSAADDSSALESLDPLDPASRLQYDSKQYYDDEIFTIQSLELTLFPHSFQQIVFTFAPKFGSPYASTVYAQIDDSADRLPIPMEGVGLPPVAQFVTDNILIGQIDLNSVFEYEFELRNGGEVPVEFRLERHKTEIKFEFSPTCGVIAVRESAKIRVVLTACAVGTFVETFFFQIQGSTDRPSLTFNGKVVGPTFVLNPRRIDFGGCSFGFLHRSKLELENKSDIDFDFRIRIVMSIGRREFQISPEDGTCHKRQKLDIIAEFIPVSVRRYQVTLLFDIERVGQGLIEIPISAYCVAPSLAVSPPTVLFENAFIGYEYAKCVTVTNSTDYSGKFEFVPPVAIGIADVRVD
jgi:hydrocephalus-inducing protein